MILVTGASGFIGSHLTKKLSEKGLPFRVLARSMPAQERLEDLGYEAAFGDVTEELSIEQAFDEIDTVVHLVSATRPTKEHSLDEINRIGTRNVVRAAEKAKVKRIIYISSVYAKEDSTNLYGLSKWGAEEEIRSSKKLKHIIFRSSAIYGRDDSFTENISNTLMKFPIITIFGNGEAKLQPIIIDEVIEVLLKAIELPITKNQAYELGGTDVVTYNELVKVLAIVLRKKRRILRLPLWLAKPFIFVLDKIMPAHTPMTMVELELLQDDQTINKPEQLFNTFELTPISLKEGLRKVYQSPRT